MSNSTNSIGIYGRRILLFLRYLVTLSALSITLFSRVQIGLNNYGPWTIKPFGKGENFYHAKWYTRLFTIFLLYIWARLFFVASIITETTLFNANDWGGWKLLVQLFYTASFDDIYDFGAGAFFFILSYLVVVVAVLQLFVSYELLPKVYRPEETNLGRSIIFGWIQSKKKEPYLVWAYLEPLLVFIISWFFYNKGYEAHAVFFAFAAIALTIQGQLKRLKSVEEEAYLKAIMESRDKTVYKQDQITKSNHEQKGKKKTRNTENDDIALHVE